jgi:hypothetical protein
MYFPSLRRDFAGEVVISVPFWAVQEIITIANMKIAMGVKKRIILGLLIVRSFILIIVNEDRLKKIGWQPQKV